MVRNPSTFKAVIFCASLWATASVAGAGRQLQQLPSQTDEIDSEFSALATMEKRDGTSFKLSYTLINTEEVEDRCSDLDYEAELKICREAGGPCSGSDAVAVVCRDGALQPVCACDESRHPGHVLDNVLDDDFWHRTEQCEGHDLSAASKQCAAEWACGNSTLALTFCYPGVAEPVCMCVDTNELEGNNSWLTPLMWRLNATQDEIDEDDDDDEGASSSGGTQDEEYDRCVRLDLAAEISACQLASEVCAQAQHVSVSCAPGAVVPTCSCRVGSTVGKDEERNEPGQEDVMVEEGDAFEVQCIELEYQSSPSANGGVRRAKGCKKVVLKQVVVVEEVFTEDGGYPCLKLDLPAEVATCRRVSGVCANAQHVSVSCPRGAVVPTCGCTARDSDDSNEGDKVKKSASDEGDMDEASSSIVCGDEAAQAAQVNMCKQQYPAQCGGPDAKVEVRCKSTVEDGAGGEPVATPRCSCGRAGISRFEGALSNATADGSSDSDAASWVEGALASATAGNWSIPHAAG